MDKANDPPVRNSHKYPVLIAFQKTGQLFFHLFRGGLVSQLIYTQRKMVAASSTVAARVSKDFIPDALILR